MLKLYCPSNFALHDNLNRVREALSGLIQNITYETTSHFPVSDVFNTTHTHLYYALKHQWNRLQGKASYTDWDSQNSPIQQTRLDTAYWRSLLPDDQKDLSPLKDRCGIRFFEVQFPKIPDYNNDMITFEENVKSIYTKHGFDALIRYVMLSNHQMLGFAHMVWNKDDLTGKERSSKCYDEIFHVLAEKGLFPHRFPIDKAHLRTQATHPFALQIYQQMRAAEDPYNIFLEPFPEAPVQGLG